MRTERVETSGAMGSQSPTSRGATSPGSPSPYRLVVRLPHRTSDGGSMEALVAASPPRTPRLLRLPKDPIQPSRGSVSDLHSGISSDNEEEENDFFSLGDRFRQRASTCPEALALQRRTKVRGLNRPPTPPPGESPANQLDKLMSKIMIKDRLKIKPRSLPGLPESIAQIESPTFDTVSEDKVLKS